MKTTRLMLALGLVAVGGCAKRTEIKPNVSQPEEQVYVPEGGCNVQDFPSATDLPSGAKNLGWVKVSQQETDEATFLALRNKICELGGDALSQAAWVKGPMDEAPELTANAWVLP